jgi:hypothetical protein
MAGDADNPTIVEACHIFSLPFELLEDIVLRLDSEDLVPLRGTCRIFHGMTQQYFAQAYFTDRAFLWWYEPGLKLLEHISRHRDFAKSMKVVRLLVLEVRSSHSLASAECQSWRADATTQAKRREKQAQDRLRKY